MNASKRHRRYCTEISPLISSPFIPSRRPITVFHVCAVASSTFASAAHRRHASDVGVAGDCALRRVINRHGVDAVIFSPLGHQCAICQLVSGHSVSGGILVTCAASIASDDRRRCILLPSASHQTEISGHGGTSSSIIRPFPVGTAAVVS